MKEDKTKDLSPNETIQVSCPDQLDNIQARLARVKEIEAEILRDLIKSCGMPPGVLGNWAIDKGLIK